MDSLKICVILPAAGSGTRTNMKPEKQFFNVLRRPVISYTISAFEELEEVTSVIVVVAEEKLKLFADIIKKFGHKKVIVVIGSNSRHKSILEGLKVSETLITNKFDIVVVHDGVRPLVQKEDILTVAKAANCHGAAGLTRPLVSTILKIDVEGFMKKSLFRNDHVASETPQAFKFKFLHDAYKKCSEDELEHGTECLGLVQKYVGIRVKLLQGSDRLWKITYNEDLNRFDRIIRCDQLKKPTVIIHELIDYDIAIKFKNNFPTINEVSLIGYHDHSEGRFPAEARTFLFIKQKFKESIESCDNFYECKHCNAQLPSSSSGIGESFIRSHLVDVYNQIHSIISNESFTHRRMCIVLICEDQTSTSLIHATKLLDELVNSNHSCNVSINSAVLLNKELTVQDVSQFLGDLHFMSSGSCHFY